MIKVSVIIPVFNGEKFISKCLDSMISQTLRDIEIICINDGSTDRTLEILSVYEKKDRRIKVFNQINRGVSIARNVGITHAQGEYIGFCDADDYVSCDFYKALYSKAIEKGKSTEIIKGNVKLIDSKGNERVDPENDRIATSGIKEFNSKWFSAIYKKDLLLKNQIFFPEEISYKEDTVFLYKSKFCSNSFAVMNNVYYYYHYQTEGSLSNSVTDKSVKDAFKNLKYRLDFVNARVSTENVYKKLFSEILSVALMYYNKYNVCERNDKTQKDIADIYRSLFINKKYSNDLIEDASLLSDSQIIRTLSNSKFNNFDYWSDIKACLDAEEKSINIEDLSFKDKFRLNIKIKDVDLKAFLLPKKQNHLYVLLSAVGHWDVRYPSFERARWAKDLEGILLFIDDPTRQEQQLDISYYFGSKEVDYKEHIATLIQKICKVYDLADNEITFIGHSNAAFAGIVLASKFQGSKCIALCPQFSIPLYLKNNKNDYEKFKKKFNISDAEEFKFNPRLNIQSLLDGPSKTKFLIYSNICSDCDLAQIKTLNFFATKKIVEGLYKDQNKLYMLVDIKSHRPHHVWPDQFICMYLERLLEKREITAEDIKTTKAFKEQLVKIETQKILAKKFEDQLRNIKLSLQTCISEMGDV